MVKLPDLSELRKTTDQVICERQVMKILKEEEDMRKMIPEVDKLMESLPHKMRLAASHGFSSITVVKHGVELSDRYGQEPEGDLSEEVTGFAKLVCQRLEEQGIRPKLVLKPYRTIDITW